MFWILTMISKHKISIENVHYKAKEMPRSYFRILIQTYFIKATKNYEERKSNAFITKIILKKFIYLFIFHKKNNNSIF